MSTTRVGNTPAPQSPALSSPLADKAHAAATNAGAKAGDPLAATVVGAGAATALSVPAPAPSKPSKADAAKAANYNVSISSGAKDRAEAYQKALGIAKSTPDVREDRVADLKARIAAGTYKPDAGEIADGMLREAIKDHLSQTSR